MNDIDTRGGKGNAAGKLDHVYGAPDWGPRAVTEGSLGAALLIEGLLEGGADGERARAIQAALIERAARLRAGDTVDLENDLAGHLAWLNALIAYAERKAIAPDVQPAAADVWFRLALRAQAAYARTVAAFAAVRMTRPKEVGNASE